MTTTERIIEVILNGVFDLRAWVEGWLGPALPILESFAIVISAMFIWGIIYTMLGSGYINYKTERYMEMLGSDTGKRRQMKVWGRILKRIRSESVTSWKQAILEADHLFDEILKMSGYRGDTIHDRFQQLSPEALSNRDKIIAAHKVRDRIRQEPNLEMSREDAVAVLQVYQHAFRELGLIP